MVRIGDTLSRQEKDFTPDGDVVRMYVCGMTPKFHPHVGHARIFVAADVLRRYLEYRGYRVRHVQNFTDIDDKIIARAIEEKRLPEEVAKEYSDSYFEAMDALNVLRAHEYPTVTGVMPQIIAFVQGLVESGHGYVGESEPGTTGGRDVWFAVDTYPRYGELSGREGALDDQQTGVRVELEPGKRDPRDFALWKSAKPDEPAWDSPWGPGRPGWHIECSAMVRETLGDTIDIHGGGRDLIFPHHENERAQSEALLGKLFVRYWAHAGLVETAGGEKMSHSLLNFRTVHDVLQAYDPMALRLYLLQTHYRSPLTFREDALAAAAQGLARLRGAVEGAAPPAPNAEGAWGDTPLTPRSLERDEGGGTPPSPPSRGTPPAPPQTRESEGTAAGSSGSETPPAPPWAAEARGRFEAAMDDDFNTSGGLAALFDLAKEINSRRQDPGAAAEVASGQATLRELAGVLGIDLAPRATAAPAGAEPFVELLLTVRQELRAAKQWALADRIRDGLRERGVVVEDQPGGSTWHFE
jgi:cysteinyl-tRNA synthetase